MFAYLTLKICCQKTFNMQNDKLILILKILGWVLLAIIFYGLIIGYACLLNEFVFPHNILISNKTYDRKCSDEEPVVIFIGYIPLGFFEVFVTGLFVFLVGALLYWICVFFWICIKCCRNNYHKAQVEVERMEEINNVIIQKNDDIPIDLESYA